MLVCAIKSAANSPCACAGGISKVPFNLGLTNTFFRRKVGFKPCSRDIIIENWSMIIITAFTFDSKAQMFAKYFRRVKWCNTQERPAQSKWKPMWPVVIPSIMPLKSNLFGGRTRTVDILTSRNFLHFCFVLCVFLPSHPCFLPTCSLPMMFYAVLCIYLMVFEFEPFPQSKKKQQKGCVAFFEKG